MRFLGRAERAMQLPCPRARPTSEQLRPNTIPDTSYRSRSLGGVRYQPYQNWSCREKLITSKGRNRVNGGQDFPPGSALNIPMSIPALTRILPLDVINFS